MGWDVGHSMTIIKKTVYHFLYARTTSLANKLVSSSANENWVEIHLL